MGTENLGLGVLSLKAQGFTTKWVFTHRDLRWDVEMYICILKGLNPPRDSGLMGKKFLPNPGENTSQISRNWYLNIIE